MYLMSKGSFDTNWQNRGIKVSLRQNTIYYDVQTLWRALLNLKYSINLDKNDKNDNPCKLYDL